MQKVYPVSPAPFRKEAGSNGVWLISVNMGYGHQRTAYPLKDLAFEEKIINANDYPGFLHHNFILPLII